MKQYGLSKEEIVRRWALSNDTRKMICGVLEIEEQDETSIMTTYRNFYLQISFSVSHPLMAFLLIRGIEDYEGSITSKSNLANLASVFGSHSFNESYRCYQYRATHWLDTEITQTRFFEILDSCVDEAIAGYKKIAS